MINPAALELDVSVGDKDFTIRQCPGVLQSTRDQGTTGAVVWRSSPLIAEAFKSPASVLVRAGLLDRHSTVVLELGAGVAGILPVTLAPAVKSYIATDQPYTLKLLQENINRNTAAVNKHSPRSRVSSNISCRPLDWETDDVPSSLRAFGQPSGVDLIVACDCIYNFALIEPLNQTCASICTMRSDPDRPSVCLAVQPLRQPDVFESWLESFMRAFTVYRLDSSALGVDLGAEYAVHIGLLRNT